MKGMAPKRQRNNFLTKHSLYSRKELGTYKAYLAKRHAQSRFPTLKTSLLTFKFKSSARSSDNLGDQENSTVFRLA